MSKLYKIILMICIFFPLQILCAQEMDGTTLLIGFEEAWLKMESSNAVLRNLHIDQAAAMREVESLSHLIPGISFSTSLSRSAPLISSFTDPSNEGRSEVENWSLRGGIDLRLNLKPTVSIENQIQVLKLNLILLEKEMKIKDLRVELEKLFYQIDAGEKTINLQERNLNLSQTRLEQTEAQYNRGLRSELELLGAQISVSRDQPTLQKARVDQEKRFIILREYLGMKRDQTIRLIPLINKEFKNETSVDDLISAAMNNMEMESSRLQLKITEKNRTLSGRNLRSPSLGLSLGWSTSINPLFDSDSWSKESWGDNLGLGLSFSVPLDPWLKGSSGQQSLSKLDDIIRKTEITMNDSLRKMEDRIYSLFLDLELSQANIQVDELNISLQEQTFEKVRQNYDTGRTSLLDLDNSRQELQKALVTLEEEKLNMNLLLIDLEMIASK